MVRDGLIHPEHVYGTINCDGMNAKGEICGVTTTSGLSWKIPGRVGDSPILGAGLYVDNAVGAAGSTGRGEANLYGLCSFLIVEEMRRGKHPKDAALEALRRVRANTVEKRLLTPDGNPNFGLNFYAFNVKGEYAGVSMYRVAVRGVHRERPADAGHDAADRRQGAVGQAPPHGPFTALRGWEPVDAASRQTAQTIPSRSASGTTSLGGVS